MNRPRIKRRMAVRRTVTHFNGESENIWLEVGDSEIRLKREGGELVWSRTLPDPGLALGNLEFSSGDLDTLDHTEGDEG